MAEGMAKNSSSPSPSPSPSIKEESKSKTLVRLFPEFWNSYPIKKAKAPALKSYERAIKSGISHITLMAGVDRAKRMDPKWAEGYIPHPSTWLNQKRWEDEFDGPTPRRPAAQSDRSIPGVPSENEAFTSVHKGIKSDNFSSLHPVVRRALDAVGGPSAARGLLSSQMGTFKAQFRNAYQSEIQTVVG